MFFVSHAKIATHCVSFSIATDFEYSIFKNLIDFLQAKIYINNLLNSY